jgi:hypothetical protein
LIEGDAREQVRNDESPVSQERLRDFAHDPMVAATDDGSASGMVTVA